jgi:hypothetical protein
VSPSWDDLDQQLLDDTANTRAWSTEAQFEAPLAQDEEILSVVPEGRESAETTMSQEDVVIPAAVAGVPPPTAPAMAAAELIEQRQDEAEEILISLDILLMSIARVVA